MALSSLKAKDSSSSYSVTVYGSGRTWDTWGLEDIIENENPMSLGMTLGLWLGLLEQRDRLFVP